MSAELEPVKIILVTGGVISGVGKGIVSSSIGVLMKANGYRVTAIKIDPYLNVDAGTFSPWEHGEVFVLDDGGEVDLDLGNYERFLNVCLTSDNNITTGKIYDRVIRAERAGKYLGKTVQVVPHVTGAIKKWIEDVAARPVDNTGLRPHVCIVELGGAVGDIELMAFMHALADLTRPETRHRFMHVHVSMLIDLESTGETKTKPVQHSVQTAAKHGLLPDLIVCRSDRPITDAVKTKIADACRVRLGQVIGVHNVSNIYRVPLLLMNQGVLEQIEERFNLRRVEPAVALENCPNIMQWTQLADLTDKFTDVVKIALVGKYFHLDHTTDETKHKVFTDAYSSVIKALKHSATHSERKLEISFVVSEHLESDAPADKQAQAWALLKEAQGVLVPGGFGTRGVEGKMKACQYARENGIPFLGVCLGMQCAAIEYARNVLGIEGASSTEFNEIQAIDKLEPQDGTEAATPAERGLGPLTSEQEVVIKMLEHSGGDMGGTMRLGRRPTIFLRRDCKLFELYGKQDAIEERHRHRYEINPALVPRLTQSGLQFVGMGIDENVTVQGVTAASAKTRNLLRVARRQNFEGEKSYLEKVDELCALKVNTAVRMEMIELKDHPYFVGVQYHPEYTSHPLAPSPPFLGLVLAASGQLKGYLDGTRMPSPVEIFRGVETPSGSNFHFLPSAGNSSASLLATLNAARAAEDQENQLRVPGPSSISPLAANANTNDENVAAPLFTVCL
uniref:CTP synthase n=1 Tax=Panagrellus redivivus TaxID=6233 RepID=A0A7E4ZR54_PANRE